MLGFFGEFLYCRRKVKCSSFNLKNGSIHKNRKFRLGIAKITYLQKVTKMGSISGHRIDYNGVGPCHLGKQCLACTNRTVTFPLGSISAISRVRSLILPEERRLDA